MAKKFNTRISGFLTTFLACLSAIILVRMWDAFRWKAVIAAVICWAALNALALVKYWYQGRKGLGQWPEPHGRFYDEWLKLPEGAGDYYDWLASHMGNREPWVSWATLDRQVREKAVRQR
jgi:hypothetical protein